MKLKKMKKAYIILAVIIANIFTINAQDQDSKIESKGGIKGGYNLAAVTFDGDTETEQISGFHAGFYVESFLTKQIAIQPELLFSQQGYKVVDKSGTFTQKLSYINLPILLKIYPVKNLFLEAGPQIGLTVAHKETFDSEFDLFSTSEELEPNNFDWGVNFGAGFKTDSGVSLGARYHIGMNDIYDEDKPKNRVWQFYIGFDL